MRSSSLGLLARVLVVSAAPLAITAVSSDAFAQEASPQDIAQARQLAQQGQAAFDAGNFAESEKLWSAAAKLYPQAPTLTLGLARAQAKAGHVVGAQESYNKIIREWSDKPNPPPAFKDALDAAKAEVGAVSARVASVVITVEGGAPNPQVTIDGQPVPSAALGLKRPVDPGQHTVKATADGYKPAETTFGVAEAGNAETKLKLEKNPDAPVAVVPVGGPVGGTEPPPPGADSGGKGSGQKTAALVAFGVGGVGLVVGAITGIIAIGKHGDLADKCTNGTCGNDLQSDVDSYKSVGTISTIGFIVAAVGAGTGAVLWFTAPKEGSAQNGSSRFATVPPPRSGFSVTPYLGAGAAGVTGRF
ncbi:MAG: PEGA domain-containing protein [Deltaproteobacteria bacterium]|nr:PEGA domain-containing protein [Deltaproteobacteria bacterium]